MRSFSVGPGRVHTLAYTPDSRSLVVDLRGEPLSHPFMGFPVRPATEIAWWDIASGTVTRRFRLRDSLYGPGGHQTSLAGEVYRQDRQPDQPAFDVAFCFAPPWVATVWEWTNKEDGVCVFDIDRLRTVDLRTPYKTHTMHIRLSPTGSKLLAATVDNMDGSTLFEVWDLSPERDDVRLTSAQAGRTSWHRERHTALRNGCANPFGSLVDLAFDGRYLACVGGDKPLLLLWDSSPRPHSEAAAGDSGQRTGLSTCVLTKG